ncbi:MAG: amino acid adenylation domain-containing protein, partial [Lutisporaceae bacterium]
NILYPLTSYQRDIWFEQELYAKKPIYNIGGYAEVKGYVHYETLQKALALFINENDAMRISIVEKEGEPYQRILPMLEYKIPFIDFSKEENPYELSIKWMETEFAKLFSYSEISALFQCTLVKANDDLFFVFFKAHHIITDGWGYSLLYNRILNNYNELVKDSYPQEKTTYSYIDFITDDASYMKSEAFSDSINFWKQKYLTPPEPLFNKESKISHLSDEALSSGRESLNIERHFYNKIIKFSEENGCSTFHFFLGMLFLYFSKIYSRDEIVIGVPILNRGKAKYKQTIGHFSNIIPLKLTVCGESTFVGLMDDIKRELKACYRHHRSPAGEIYKAVFGTNLYEDNLYDISLSYEKNDYFENFINTESRALTIFSYSERNPLTIFVREFSEDKDVQINFDYQLRIFDKNFQIKNVVSHFKHLMYQIIEKENKKISNIEVITTQERQKILYSYNNTDADYARSKTIHELFEEQVEKTPDNTAVVFKGTHLTYDQLNKKANQLARLLIEKGVKRNSIVGIMIERSVEMMVGVMGILKAGAAYLPISPQYPDRRIEYLIKDSGLRLLITNRQAEQDNLEPILDTEIIYIDDEGLYQGDYINIQKASAPTDLAYVIYTSGSTGEPKGVMLEHHSVINRISWMQKAYPIGQHDTILQKTSFTFDVSVWELLWWSFTGAKTCFLAPGDEKDPSAIVNAILENNITVIHFVPSMLNVFLEYVEDGICIEKLQSLKYVFSSGEALTLPQVEKFNSLLHRKCGTQLINLYGPTEAAIDVSYFECSTDEELDIIPIGKPIDNIRLYIVDKYNKLQPPGVPGELYISGVGLARGYLNKPELTAQRFITLEDEQLSNQLVYKTGDRARWLPDGNIEFMGRLDCQVKVRGYRVELGEIESHILKHESVKEAVVIDRESSHGDRQLCAYFTSDKKVSPEELSEYLQKELPNYMVPSYFVQLEEMPLTINGKISRKALPESWESISTEIEYIAPSDIVEEHLVLLCQNILKVNRIGMKDDFFKLGGTSLDAAVLISRIAKVFDVEIQLIDIFKNSIIGDIAKLIKQ